MAKVIIVSSLEEEINKRFKKESIHVLELLKSVEENPKKGKLVGQISGTIIKELKYGVYRFYFITDGHAVKYLRVEELVTLIVKFVRLSDKDTQQEVIEEIKNVLRKIGTEGFS